jgi:DtxR family Mn-dependent transcriptional regulator
MPKIDALDDNSPGNDLSHQAIEDYLKTIYALAENESPVSTSRIAEARHVKPASVTNMIQRLAKLNLVHYEKHYGVTLTESGLKIALEVIRHHRLLELYLIEALGFRWDEVHEQADLLEHVISEKMEERIAEALGHPTVDPHGAPIPAPDGTMPEITSLPLTALQAGDTAVIAEVNDDNPEILRYLAELGLIPGAEIGVTAVAPFDGPLTLQAQNKEIVLGFALAKQLFVTTQNDG